MSMQLVWPGEHVRMALQDNQFVYALYILVSVRLRTWAGGLSLIQYIMQKYLVDSRSEVMKKQIQTT